MKDKSSYQVILEKIQELLRSTEGKKLKEGVVPKELSERLDVLEKAVDEFVKLNDQFLEKLGATPEEIQQALSKPNPFLSERDAATMRFGRQVLADARRRYTDLSLLMRAIDERGEIDTKTGRTRVLGKVRQKRKFGRLGGQGKWLPM